MRFPPGQIIQPRVKARDGRHEAEAALVPLAYDEIRRMLVDHARARQAKSAVAPSRRFRWTLSLPSLPRHRSSFWD